MKTAISIADLAQKICNDNPRVKIQVKYRQLSNEGSLGYNPEMKISLNTHKIEELGWKPQYTLSETFDRLIDGLKEKNSC